MIEARNTISQNAMATTGATEEILTTSIGKASWRALIAWWLGWMFDGYESWALVLVMGLAVHQLLPPEKLPEGAANMNVIRTEPANFTARTIFGRVRRPSRTAQKDYDSTFERPCGDA